MKFLFLLHVNQQFSCFLNSTVKVSYSQMTILIMTVLQLLTCYARVLNMSISQILCYTSNVCYRNRCHFYKVQYECKKLVCLFQMSCVSNSPGYVSTKNWQNWTTSDQVITNIKRVMFF